MSKLSEYGVGEQNTAEKGTFMIGCITVAKWCIAC